MSHEILNFYNNNLLFLEILILHYLLSVNIVDKK